MWQVDDLGETALIGRREIGEDIYSYAIPLPSRGEAQ